MARTYKRLGLWGGRHIKGHHRSKQNHKEIRPGARVPDPWNDLPWCNLCHLPYKIAFKLHEKGWSEDKIRDHLRWKFKLSDHELDRTVSKSYFWKCNCKQCKENRYYV